jgi:cytochrome c-type biogenesis protein CcmH/NrfF
MKRLAEILLLCAAVASLMGADTQEARYQRLGSKIMCACGCSEMLLKCNHVGCQDSDRMIRELRASVQQYSNDDDVLNWFRKNWGVTAVVEPGTHGLELWAWILPPAALGVGLLLVIVFVRKWRLRTAPATAANAPVDPHLESLRARARRETEI